MGSEGKGMSKQAKQLGWRDRVVGFTRKPASQFTANSLNFRRHPNAQREAFRGIVSEVGFAGAVLENVRTGNLIDGHLRIEEALSVDDRTPIPVVQVDLSESEEKLLLASYDPISAMAVADRETLDLLLRDVATGEAAVSEMLAKLAEDNGVVPADWSEAFNGLSTGDKAPFQQMTFTVSDAQAGRVKAALERAKAAGEFADTGNENSNGNALARIAEAYLGG